MISPFFSIRKALIPVAWCVLVFLSLSVRGADTPKSGSQRIVSLAPSITEILFALGVGDRLVGVTRYCDYPPEAGKITKVGGYVDPDYEHIATLKPDLAILLTSHGDAKRLLERLGVPTLTVPSKTIDDIHEAIEKIGEACGAWEEARKLVGKMKRRHEAVRRSIGESKRPRVLICIGRERQSDYLGGMYIAGRNGFYDEMIEAAGGVNAYVDERIAYPQLSMEGVIRIDPDVIVDLASHIESGAKTPEEMVRQWDQLRTVKAVRNGRVHVIVGTHALRPGPRYLQFFEELTALLHPEACGKQVEKANAASQ